MEELTYAELTTSADENEVFLMEIGKPDESDAELNFEEETFYGDEFDLNDTFTVAENGLQQQTISSATDIINQVAIGSLGVPSNLNVQRFNFNKSAINFEKSQSVSSTPSSFLKSKEPSVLWSTLEPTDGNCSKFDAELQPTLNVEGDTIRSFFEQIIDDTMLQKICDWTNELHAIDLTIEELRCFIGLLLLFGVLKKRDVEVSDLWSSTSLQYVPQTQATMPRDRFYEITMNLTFYDPNLALVNMVKNKKFYKFQQVFDLFKMNNKYCITPGVRLSVDETLYSFRGRFGALQFIKSKPARYGFKYWVIVDNRSIYVLDIDIYLGKNGDVNKPKDRFIGQSVVLKLCEQFFDHEA